MNVRELKVDKEKEKKIFYKMVLCNYVRNFIYLYYKDFFFGIYFLNNVIY